MTGAEAFRVNLKCAHQSFLHFPQRRNRINQHCEKSRKHDECAEQSVGIPSNTLNRGVKMDSWFVGIAAGLMMAVSMVVMVELCEAGIRNDWVGSSVDYVKTKAALYFYPPPPEVKKPASRKLMNQLNNL